MTISPQDLNICREIHAGLTSRERSNFNYIFLEPVDIGFFTTYLTIVDRPMDLGTLKENLENGVYETKEEFYADTKVIFDNAILFNRGREDSSWVVDLAKRMLKAFDRVRKTAEKKAARLAGNGGSGGGQKSSKEKKSSSGGDQKISKDGDKKASKVGKKKKLNIKMKRQKSTSSIGDLSSVDSVVAGEVTSTPDSKPAKKSKTKIKLKLSRGGSDAKKSLKLSTGGSDGEKSPGRSDAKKSPGRSDAKKSSGSDAKKGKASKTKIRMSASPGPDSKEGEASKPKIKLSASSGSDAKKGDSSKTKLKLSASSGSEAKKGDAPKSKLKLSASSGSDGKKGEASKTKIKLSASSGSDAKKADSSKTRLRLSSSPGPDAKKAEAPKPKIKLSASSGADGKEGDAPKAKVKLSSSFGDVKKADAPKPKLKLSTSSGSDAKKADTPKPKTKLSSSSGSDGKKADASKPKIKLSASSGSDAKKADAPKPKIKLSSSSGSDAKKTDAPKAKAKPPAPPKLDVTAGKSEEVRVAMSSFHREQCYKIISGLKRRRPAACKWFHKPVTDPAIVNDYKEKIAHPTDLSSILSKLDKDQYKHVDEFVLDLRRISANCLQYNTTLDDSFRPLAVDFLTTAEDLCKLFLAKHELPKVAYPSLLYCWADCVKAIDELIQLTNPEDGLQTAWYFLHPVSYFCGGEYPDGYLDKVKKPIDLGTIIQHLLTGSYKSVGAFVADCRSVSDNCHAFYAGNDEGEDLCNKAKRLYGSMEKNLGQLFLFDQSEKGAKAREKATSKYMTIKRPEKDFLKGIMSELRAATYTDRSAKITERATTLFEKPVDITVFTDYPQFVETPMDLETVDRKIEAGSYVTPEDFEYDIALIFKNCERYNGPKKNIHMVNLGKNTAKIFRKLFAEKLRGGSAAKRPTLPTSSSRMPPASMGGKSGKGAGKVAGKKRPASPAPDERQTKRVSIKGPSRTASKSASNSSSGKSAPKSKAGKKLAKATPKIIAPISSGPIPMHVAIASIKESYPGRRQIKDLEGWEAECMKFMRQLMKHPWVSAERPKYIFHVPVPILFPDIRDTYAAKIENPMDLTTAEAKLLAGYYTNAEEFITDIALVFSNAIAFNKEGHDVGELMSCAYYEASTHLLKYIRWLSLELLQPYLTDCLDSPVVESGSASEWKLTNRNREMARKEMESVVFNELLDKTEPGDKFSWSEQECEKLLKSLRHMSDYKHMGYFVQMNFPPDYTAFISKPIAWDKCQEKLKQRKYNTIGETVADLRLIFVNAIKYNEGARHVSKVSGMAYDSAIHMSGKLEAAIDKMLLTVGDRIGRERIDMITSHREMEEKERAEEAQRKSQWEKENPGSTVEVKTKLRIIHQRNSHRKKMTDFEFPFFDEEEDQVESHTDSLEHAKALFKKQREARANMQDIALSVGISVFRRHQEVAAAKAWVHQMARKAHAERVRIEEEEAAAKKEENTEETPAKQIGACVQSVLNDDSRKQIKMAIHKPKKLKRKLFSL